ncbi:MAG: hypothetical protein LBT07_02695 [Endomicrobium sp.]|nr:hypothetical protein [Endomicrobium sp.]
MLGLQQFKFWVTQYKSYVKASKIKREALKMEIHKNKINSKNKNLTNNIDNKGVIIYKVKEIVISDNGQAIY